MNSITSMFNPSSYFFKSKHLSTILPSIIRKIEGVNYKRLRIDTFDHDFLDLDFSFCLADQSDEITVILHGLEGDSTRQYIKGMVRSLNQKKMDCVVINFRSCSEEPNKLYSAYHTGKTDDLSWVIQYIEKNYTYKKINLIGFSLGGNVTLKYLGEYASSLPKIIHRAVAISVPCDLKSSAYYLHRLSNRIYLHRFLKTLKEKALYKSQKFPEKGLTVEQIQSITNFTHLDDLYTGPAHGFKDALDYWQKNSSKPFIKNIVNETLIINALNDPFLPEECYPYKEVKENGNIKLITPEFGGHVGFCSDFNSLNQENWVESKAAQFLSK